MMTRKPSGPKTSSKPSSSPSPAATSVPSTEVKALFDRIADDYDRFNAWASLGLHHRWRRALIEHVPKEARVLDLATGTGDVAFLAVQAGHQVVGVDFSDAMLGKARQKDTAQRVKWIQASANRLPFSDRSFDCVTSAFALRNIRGILDASLKENWRVLRSGGKVLHMDFGRPQRSFYRWGHRLHLNYGIPFIGQRICGDRWPKNYLETTIQHFYEPSDMVQRLTAAGFTQVRHTALSWGVVQLYEGIKI